MHLVKSQHCGFPQDCGKWLLVSSAPEPALLIHGIQWATLGYLESKHQSVLKLRWHNNVRLINQVLIGPIMIIWEILRLVFGAKTIKEVGIKENVTKIDDQKMAAFHFLQDFYLHFAQFYSHTSYALVICFISVLVFIIHAGFTYPRLAILIAIYLLCGLFYIIGRIQFQSLFKGESELVSRPRRPPFNYRFWFKGVGDSILTVTLKQRSEWPQPFTASVSEVVPFNHLASDLWANLTTHKVGCGLSFCNHT